MDIKYYEKAKIYKTLINDKLNINLPEYDNMHYDCKLIIYEYVLSYAENLIDEYSDYIINIQEFEDYGDLESCRYVRLSLKKSFYEIKLYHRMKMIRSFSNLRKVIYRHQRKIMINHLRMLEKLVEGGFIKIENFTNYF